MTQDTFPTEAVAVSRSPGSSSRPPLGLETPPLSASALRSRPRRPPRLECEHCLRSADSETPRGLRQPSAPPPAPKRQRRTAVNSRVVKASNHSISIYSVRRPYYAGKQRDLGRVCFDTPWNGLDEHVNLEIAVFNECESWRRIGGRVASRRASVDDRLSRSTDEAPEESAEPASNRNRLLYESVSNQFKVVRHQVPSPWKPRQRPSRQIVPHCGR